MTAHSRAWLQIHVCVVLWGFTAILGRLITLPALPLVWWRMLLVTLALAVWPPFWRACGEMPRRLVAIYAGIGVLVTLHWITFYGSIKLSNASVAATCMALTPVFVSIIEPSLARRRPNLVEVGMSVAVLPGRGAGRGRHAGRDARPALPSARSRRSWRGSSARSTSAPSATARRSP